MEPRADSMPKVSYTFPYAADINVTAFTLISLRLGPPEVANVGLEQSLGLQVLEKLNISSSFIKDLEHFVVTLRKPEPGKITYDEDSSSPKFLKNIQWRTQADPQEIESEDGDAAFLRTGWDLVRFNRSIEYRLETQIHSMNSSDKYKRCQVLEDGSNKLFNLDVRKSYPYFPDMEADRNQTLQKGRDLQAWCTELSSNPSNKSRGSLLLLMFVSAPNTDTPVDVCSLWNGTAFHNRARWIGEYTRLHMPELRELVIFLDHAALQIYRYGYLNEGEREEFCKGLEELTKLWTARAKSVE
jgi:hypothetical protein